MDGAAVGAVVVGRPPILAVAVAAAAIDRAGAEAETGNEGLPAGVHLKEGNVDTTTLLIIVVIVLLLGGGGWYGRGRWF